MREFEEMRNMTPEERRARFAQRGGPGGGMDRMMRERIKYTTPEQQAENNRRMLQMRQRMQQSPPGGQPGQPGPGQPPAPNR